MDPTIFASKPNLIIKYRKEQDIDIVYLEGRFTEKNLYFFKDALEEMQVKGSLILNLEKVSLMDSSGIGIVVKIYKDFCDNNAKIIFCVNSNIMKEFKKIGLDRILQLCETESEAIQKLTST